MLPCDTSPVASRHSSCSAEANILLKYHYYKLPTNVKYENFILSLVRCSCVFIIILIVIVSYVQMCGALTAVVWASRFPLRLLLLLIHVLISISSFRLALQLLIAQTPRRIHDFLFRKKKSSASTKNRVNCNIIRHSTRHKDETQTCECEWVRISFMILFLECSSWQVFRRYNVSKFSLHCFHKALDLIQHHNVRTLGGEHLDHICWMSTALDSVTWMRQKSVFFLPSFDAVINHL